MKIDARSLLLPLVAVAVLVLTLQQTLGALRASGSWRPRKQTHVVRPEDPYTRIDNLLDRDRLALDANGLRNPFAYGSGRAVVSGPPKPAVHVTPVPVEPARPSLTSIIWDNDPRATLRYDGRDIPVRVNTLFADFRVTSITANTVVLDRNGESIVLTLRSKGE